MNEDAISYLNKAIRHNQDFKTEHLQLIHSKLLQVNTEM